MSRDFGTSLLKRRFWMARSAYLSLLPVATGKEGCPSCGGSGVPGPSSGRMRKLGESDELPRGGSMATKIVTLEAFVLRAPDTGRPHWVSHFSVATANEVLIRLRTSDDVEGFGLA